MRLALTRLMRTDTQLERASQQTFRKQSMRGIPIKA